MPTPDLLTLIQTACRGTAAEGLAPDLSGPVPRCGGMRCDHFSEATCSDTTWGLCSLTDAPPFQCEPTLEALARLAVEGAAEVERLTAELAAATAYTVPGDWQPSNDCEPAAVEGVDLVWVEIDGDWLLTGALGLFGRWNCSDHRAIYYDDDSTVRLHCTIPSAPTACLWLARLARADGCRVPKHPLGWDVGVER